MSRRRDSYRLVRFCAILVAAALGLAVAFLAGRGAGSPSEPAGDAPQANGADSAHTAAGAVAAYLKQQAALADPWLWVANPERQARALDEMLASRELRRSIQRSIEIVISSRNALGRALRSHRPLLARSAPLGYRVISYSPHRALVDVWIFSLLGGDGIPLDLRLIRYRALELWHGDAWQLAATRAVGEGNAVRFRGAPPLSAALASNLAGFRRLAVEP